MLSVIRKNKKIIKIIILSFLLLFDIIFISNRAKADTIQDFYNANRNYKNEGFVNNLKNKTPNYDDSCVNSDCPKSQVDADKFLDYGTTLTDSCTVNVYEETRTAVCDNRTEYEYQDVNISQSKILDHINYVSTTRNEVVTVYYCDTNNQTYNNLNTCNNNCIQTATCSSSYICNNYTTTLTLFYSDVTGSEYLKGNIVSVSNCKSAVVHLWGTLAVKRFGEGVSAWCSIDTNITVSLNGSDTLWYGCDGYFKFRFKVSGNTYILQYATSRTSLLFRDTDIKVWKTSYYSCPLGNYSCSGNPPTCSKSVACSTQQENQTITVQEAKFYYVENPSSFDPLVNCVLNPYQCVDSRNTCVTKDSSGNCIEYQNVCWEYQRSGTCQEQIEHTYVDCNYNTTSVPVN